MSVIFSFDLHPIPILCLCQGSRNCVCVCMCVFSNKTYLPKQTDSCILLAIRIPPNNVHWQFTAFDYLLQTTAAAKSLQSCPTLCDSLDGGPPGSSVPGILQARILEWVAISFSNAWKGKVKVKSLSRVRLFATSWSAAYQAPPSMGFSRQEYWSGVPLFLNQQLKKYISLLWIYIF